MWSDNTDTDTVIRARILNGIKTMNIKTVFNSHRNDRKWTKLEM